MDTLDNASQGAQQEYDVWQQVSEILDRAPAPESYVTAKRAKSRAFDRLDNVHFNWNWIMGDMLAMCADWREAFQVMRFNDLYHAATLYGDENNGDIDACRGMTDDDVIALVEKRDERFAGVVIGGEEMPARADQVREDLAFWDCLTQIYTEEMQEAERIGAEARERVIERATRELGELDKDLAKALRNNTPQKYLSDLDWN